jgi:uncharacterized protein YegP (UPF0339 family)
VRSATAAAKFEAYTSSNGEDRSRLKSGNGQVIATSGERYTSKNCALNGIDAVKRDAGTARTEDQT